MVGFNFKKQGIIYLFLLLTVLFSSFAFADLKLEDTKIKSEDLTFKYDYIIEDSKDGSLKYDDIALKDISDTNRQEIKIKKDKTELKFLDSKNQPTLTDSDYKLNKNVISFDSEKYKTDKNKKLSDFMQPVIVDDKIAVAKLTFDVSSDDWVLEENETSIAFVYKSEGFYDNEREIIDNGVLHEVIYFNSTNITYYADSFSSFAVVTLQTYAPNSVNHGTYDVEPVVRLQIDNPDNDAFELITQYRHVTSTGAWSSLSPSQTSGGSAPLLNYILDPLEFPETHVRYRYRVSILHAGTLYSTTTGPTFDLGIVVGHETTPVTITDTTATFSGFIGDSLNGFSALSCGFQYRESGTSSWTGATGETTVTSLYGDYELTATGLTAGTEYDYRAYCWDSRQGINVPAGGNTNDWYSEFATFTTSGTAIGDPNVDTNPATSVGDTTVTLNGDLTDLGSETSVTGRFLYRKVGATVFTSVGDQTLSVIGSFTHSLTGLDSCTNYEYKARVAYGLDVDDGAIQTFQTTGCPTGTGIATDLISYYKLDETSGTIVTDSHGANDGTNNGATVGVTGILNTAYDFDGVNDHVLRTIPSNNFGSISAHINVDSYGDSYILGLSDNTVNTKVFGIFINDDGKISIQQRDGDVTDRVISSSTISLNTDYHIVITADGIEWKLYINNVEDTLIVTNGANNGEWFNDVPTANVFAIGALFLNGFFFYYDGMLDEVGIWSRALTSEEVSDLYNSGVGLAYPLEVSVSSYTVDTLPATNIGTTTVNLNGDITDMGGETTLTAGFEYKRSIDSEWIATATQLKSTASEYGVLLSSLQPETEYQYRAVIQNGDIVKGGIQNFTTLSIAYPSILTRNPLTITQDTINFRGELLDLGDFSQVELTFSYREGLEGNFTKLDYEPIASVFEEPAIYSVEVDGLNQSRQYQYRMIARVDGTTEIVGNTITTATLSFSPPTLEYVGTSDITQTSARLIGEILNISEAEPNYELTFLIGEAGGIVTYEETAIDIQTSALSIPYTHEETITGLTPDTQYMVYFKLTYTSGGIEYTELSPISTFTTSSESLIGDEDEINEFFDNFTAGNKTVKFIVALVLIIGMFIFGFQVTNTVIGGGIMAVLGLILSVVLGLIGIWVLILLLIGICLPFIFKLAFGRN